MGAARSGLPLYLASMAAFASIDAVSKLLAEAHSPIMIVMVRYWAFAGFVIAVSAARPGGLRAAAKTRRPGVHMLRALALVLEIVIITYSFAAVGLAETHAVFAVYPLIVAAMGALLLGERAAPAQWAAIALGFIGVLVIIDPGAGVFDLRAAIPLGSALLFAAYGALTRWIGQYDPPEVSFFYTGVFGAIAASLVGPFFWSEMSLVEWGWMGALCVFGVLSQYFLIRAYDRSEAAVLQPYAYLHLLLAGAFGVVFFNEALDARLLIGGGIVVAAGLFALLWEQRRARSLKNKRAGSG